MEDFVQAEPFLVGGLGSANLNRRSRWALALKEVASEPGTLFPVIFGTLHKDPFYEVVILFENDT